MPNSTSASDNPSKGDRAPGNATRPRHRWRRRLLVGLASAGGLVLVLWGVLLTPPGLRGAAFIAERAILAGSGLTARIENVSGTLPFSLRVGRFALADAKGTWLAIADARLAWSPAALFRGRVLIDEISADIVRLRRAPEVPAASAPATVEWPPRFPSPPPILIDRLHIGRLILDKELAGQDAVITLDGRLAESGRGAVGLALSASRLDGDKRLAARLAGSLNYAAWSLAVRASLTDAPGGLLASALAGPDGGGLSATLAGDGPLAAWKGRLTATLGPKDLLTADLGLAVPLHKAAMASFSLEATATPLPGLLPASAARLIGERPSVRLAGRFGLLSGDFFLDTGLLTTAVGTCTATAGLDAVKNTLTAKARLSLPDAARLDPSLSGALTADLTASGPLPRPRLTVRLTGSDLKAGPVALAKADVTATARPAGDLDGPFPGASLTATGNLTGLAGPEGTTLLGGALTLDMAADLDAAGNLVAQTGRLTGSGGAITLADVRYAAGKLSGKCSLDVADLSGAASLAGLHLGGGLAAKADVTADAAGTGKAALSLDISRLVSRDPADTTATALAALLGATPKLTAQADFSAKGAHLSGLTLTAKALSLAGSGDYDAVAETLAAKAAIAAPDLAVLGPALGVPCAGGLTATVDVAGPAASPRLTVTAQADRPRLANLVLSAATLTATAADLAANPNGKLTLTARRQGEAAKLEAGYALAGSLLTVKDLRLTAPEAAFSGDATLDTASGRVTGKLNGTAANLAGLGRFVGQPLAGSLKITASAAANRTGQNLVCDLAASGLRLPGLLAASHLTVAASLDDLTGNPRGKATIAAKGLATGGLSLTTLSLAATGDGRAMAASLDTRGTLPGGRPLTLTAKTSLATSGPSRRITLGNLSGSLDTKKFTLTAPATLVLESGGAMRLDGLALAFDQAKIQAAGSLTSRGVSAKATIGKFPLAVLAAFGLPVMDGTGTVAASLSGSPTKPELAAEVHLDGLGLASEKGKGLPTLTVAATANLTGGKASLRATVGNGSKKEAVVLDAAVPLRLALSPFAFDLPPGGALSGRITADSDLTQMATLLAQANTRIHGRLTADLALGGSLAAPTVSGSLALAAQKLENADTGLVLRNLTLRADASGGTIRIAQASGQDGRGGSFTLSGQIGIADLAGGPVDLALKLAHLRVAGLDLATVTADGGLNVSGTLSRMRAVGKITLGPADINLPTSLPPDVVVIPVTLVNDPNAPKKKTKIVAPAAARHIDLDLTVALGQSVSVHGLGLESRWTGQVKVTGTAAAPVVVGKYSVEKGRVELFGSNLDITKGEVVFTGATPPAPTFDIRAENTSNDITAGVSITGDATNPVISLTSTPPLPHDEILSRILFGQSASTLSPIQAAQLAQAAASLYAGGTPTSILARTRRILGLDQLTLVSGKGGVSSTVLRAGKEIVKGVTVGVEQGMGAQSGAVSVEVQVTPNITVDSRVGANNKQGVGVNWKWDY